MTALTDFPNAELVLQDEFDAVFTWHSGSVRPADLHVDLPYVIVRRIGGNTDTVNDYPLMAIDVFASTYAVAMDVAEKIRSHITGPGRFISQPSGQIDRAICTSAHIELPSDDPARRRFSTQYRVTCRRLPA